MVKKMKTIEFLGNGKDQGKYCSPGIHHCDSVIGVDYTLCGITTDGDSATAGDYRTVEGKINCKDCLAIILFCKKIPNKSLLT